MEKVLNKFLRYVSYDTTSDPDSTTAPTSLKQLELSKQLLKELKEMKIDAKLGEGGVVYGSLPSNIEKIVPSIGFIAHVDTSPDASGKDIKTKVIENYDGNDIILNKEKQIIMSVTDYPLLKDKKGERIIVTDGTTLLGADDKAGVAVIMEAVQTLVNNPSIKHGPIKIAFTPDEEVGKGVDNFDVKYFDCEFAYTVDGGSVWAVEYENFNAASAKIEISGRNIHPGSAKDKMVNAINIATEFNSMIPETMTPEHTEGYEGFFHSMHIEGSVEKASISYIIRNHDVEKMKQQKEFLLSIGDFLNKKHKGDWVKVNLKDAYRNMRSLIENKMYIVDIAKEAISMIGYTPIDTPIRGGTDGASLTYMGLPCPNLGAGGYNFHGRFEYASLDEMEKSVEMVLQIIDIVKER